MNHQGGEDVRLSEQMYMIRSIIFRDVASAKLAFIVMLIFSIFIGGLFSLIASAIDDAGIRQIEWTVSSIMPFYGLAIVINIAAFLSAYYQFYSVEVGRGTIRSLSLYPLNMNGIIIAKLISSSIVASIASTMVYLSIWIPFMWIGLYPPGGILLIQYTAVFCSISILTVAAFGSNICIYLLKLPKLSGSGLSTLGFVLAFLFTESMMVVLGSFYSIFDPDVTWEAVRDTSEAFAQLSPFHAGGQFISLALLGPGGGLDLHFILPFGLFIIILGYLCGRKIYLDVFITD
jgi:hypothetical protein